MKHVTRSGERRGNAKGRTRKRTHTHVRMQICEWGKGGGGGVEEGKEGTMSRMIKEWTRRVLGHLLFRSLVRSHRSLIRLLRTTCFACTLAHSLTHSQARGKVYDRMTRNDLVLSHSGKERKGVRVVRVSVGVSMVI